jgi:hypothetical protein
MHTIISTDFVVSNQGDRMGEKMLPKSVAQPIVAQSGRTVSNKKARTN